MKKLFFIFCLLPVICFAQPGYIRTVVGTGSAGYSGDGGPATAARMGSALGVAVDLSGNIYFPDHQNSVVRKVNTAGIITTIAGGGGSTADGIAATSADLSLNATGAITIDTSGNVIFSETYRVRKVSVSTGIITTIAGTGSSGFSGDGGPATAATFAAIHGVHMTSAGELYITDAGNVRIRKVNSAGTISTVVGTGTTGFSGDGGPATSAQLNYPSQVSVDRMGNLYIADCLNDRIRKVNSSGIISTVAGGGSGGDGSPATAAGLADPGGVCVDIMGNIYIADFHASRVRIVNTSGIINTIAGGGSSSAEGIPATSAHLTNVWSIGIDNFGNTYIPEQSGNRIRRVGCGIPTAIADSFSVFISPLCAGPSILINPEHYSPSLRVQTWFGDGTTQTDTFSSFSGCAFLNHTYIASGSYTIKCILYNGSIPIDTVQHSFAYTKCTTIPVNLYYDSNGNCTRDTGESAFLKTMNIIVDSNSVSIDTISCISGVYYNAFGTVGDVYTFRAISSVTGLSVTCPSSGIISDTIVAGIYSNRPLNFAFSCDTIHAFDLGTHFSVIGTGRHAQTGNIYAFNNYCAPTNGIVTLYHSPKYAYYTATPTPTSTTATSISWNLPGLTNINALTHLYYWLEVPSTSLMPGDTTNSIVTIAPGTGDADTSNNVVIRNDTVRSSYDPNFIESSPSGHIYAGSTLRYTVGFENDGNDTAQNIYVLDTLSDNLEAGTLKPVFASHEMYIEKLATIGGQTVYKFDFPNIKLLDSSYRGLCEGTFQYDIKVKDSLPDCTLIPARVGIYFDDNEVVMTNTFTNVIGCWPVVILNTTQPALGNIHIYPNPASDVLNIKTEGGVFESYTITNSIGTIVISSTINNELTEANIKGLPAGLYFVTVKGKNGNSLKKFIKW